MIRAFRLTNEPGGLGLSCTSAGLSLAAVSLLRKTGAGFAPRSAPEIVSLLKAAYGAQVEPRRLQSSLGAIAEALNGGDIARAGIAAVLTRTPELSEGAAQRLTRAEEELKKYNFNPAEPRDSHGRWTTDGAAGSINISAPVDLSPARRAADLIGPPTSNPDHGGAVQYASEATGDDSLKPDDGASDSEPRKPTSLKQEFEREYDELGPVEFAKRVIEFGYRLATAGQYFSATEKERALAEYSFLQNRLSFWLGYEYKPPTAQGNLISAAQTLFQGAIFAEIVQPGHLPRSMLDVAAGAWAIDNLPQTRNRLALEPTEIAPPPRTAPREGEGALTEAPKNSERATASEDARETENLPAAMGPLKEVEGLGGIVDNSKVGIKWDGSGDNQGFPWEGYLGRSIPDAELLPAGSKAFDLFRELVGEAISAKTLNTLSASCIKNPQAIYFRLKRYIDAAANYTPRAVIDKDPMKITSKTIHLAIPEYTSPTQWRYLYMAIIYGERRNISLVITRIRE
jgi:hypothetical protein